MPYTVHQAKTHFSRLLKEAEAGQEVVVVVRDNGMGISSEALAHALDGLLGDPMRLNQMRSYAAEWTRVSFAPDRYAPLAVARLL